MSDETNSDILATLRNDGEYFHEPTNQHLLVATVGGKRRIIGRVSGRVHAQDPGAADALTRLMWRRYFQDVLRSAGERHTA